MQTTDQQPQQPTPPPTEPLPPEARDAIARLERKLSAVTA